MKKREKKHIFLLVVLFLFSCEKELFDEDISLSNKITYELEEAGMDVAKRLHDTAIYLNNGNYDYWDAKDNDEFRERFYTDFLLLNGVDTASITYYDIKEYVSQNFHRNYTLLTPIQVKYIEEIISICDSHILSYQVRREKLCAVIDEINFTVSKNERERLLYICSVMYYALKEIESLEEMDMLLRTDENSILLPLTRSENIESGEGFFNTCRTFATSVWTIAVGEPTLYGEIVASIVTVVLAAASILYYVTVCPAEVNCQAKYEECEQYYPEYAAQHSGGYGYSMCARCFEYCQFQNVWDCPRPI